MHFNYPGEGAYPNGFGFGDSNFSINFYALIILFGAIVALLLASYNARKDGFSFDFFFTVFLIAFPCGIIGARIWYVIAEFDHFLKNSNGFGDLLWNMINLKSGGLAIQGGALGGILAGVLFVKFRRKGTPILRIADFAVPGILVAQAIGRWGNFFNQEVYGRYVSSAAWDFLPSFITNNMVGGAIGSQNVVPLFLVEGILNIGGYFFISYFYRLFLGKHCKDGDQSFLYLVVYGFIRMVMEPMRNSSYIMGNSVNQMKSFWMAFAFIAFGLVFIFLNHLLRYLESKGKIKHNKFIDWFINNKYSSSKNGTVASLEGKNSSTGSETNIEKEKVIVEPKTEVDIKVEEKVETNISKEALNDKKEE